MFWGRIEWRKPPTITPGGLEKAFLAAGHDVGFLWGSIWSEELGEDRETMKVSVVEEIILGTWF